MLLKLLKHELRATGRILLPLCGGALFLALAARLGNALFTASWAPESVGALTLLLNMGFFLGLGALFVGHLVVMLRQFRYNLLGDEGYLMMTLPVSIHALLWSKLLCAFLWFLAALGTALLAGFIFARGSALTVPLRVLGELVSEGSELLLGIDMDAVRGLGWQLPLLALVGGFSSLLRFYAALSTGYGAAKHRLALSVLFYLGVGVMMDYITAGITGIGFRLMTMSGNLAPAWNLTFALALTARLVSAILYYCATVVNLRYRLNLE